MATKLSKDGLSVTKDGGGDFFINFNVLKRASLTLRALNHPLRKRILAFVEEKKKIPVTEIYVKLKIEQSVASQHLAILRKAEIVKTTREGKFMWYTPNKKRLEAIAKLIDNLAQPE